MNIGDKKKFVLNNAFIKVLFTYKLTFLIIQTAATRNRRPVPKQEERALLLKTTILRADETKR